MSKPKNKLFKVDITKKGFSLTFDVFLLANSSASVIIFKVATKKLLLC